MARRKGDPLSGVSTGLASVVIATINAIPAVHGRIVDWTEKLTDKAYQGK
jgi:hypothetical protein